MSYESPTKEDRHKLVVFHKQLDQHFDRDSERNIVIDNIRVAFEQYLHPENHSRKWVPPFPPMARDTFFDLSVTEREEAIEEDRRQSIQDDMESAALLSQLHGVSLQDIEGLEQSPEELRKKLNDARSNSQTTVAEFS